MFIEVQNMELVFHITEPWYIESANFNEKLKQLDIYLKFRKGSTFTCSGCGASHQRFYDIADQDRSWRHLNFLEYPSYIHAPLPRTSCQTCGHILRVEVSWAVKPRSSFTRHFDAFIITMAKDMPMNAISRMVHEEDKKLWRIVHYYVEHAIATQDLSHVTKINVDETSAKRGHNYVSIFMDPETKSVIHITKGKDSATWSECKNQLESHGGNASKITEVCMDMSPAFLKGAREQFPEASITFDKFHVIQIVNKAVDEVRRTESKKTMDLKNTRYLYLKNPQNLTTEQEVKLEKLSSMELDTGKAYRMRLVLQEIFRYPATIAPDVLKDWINWGLRCKLEPMVQVAKTIQNHFNGIVRWFSSKLNNGILEGVNSLFQAAKRKARGYRSDKNIVAMVYLLAGKLDFSALKYEKN
jgi:transposase